MAEKFKAFIYGVETASSISNQVPPNLMLRNTIARAWAEPPSERIFTVGGKDYRLEHCAERSGLHFLNFISLRFSGPGRVSLNQPVTSFNLSPNESFGYETAMLYDEREKLAFIQSSTPGITASAIGTYLTSYVWDRSVYYQFNPLLDQNARVRALRFHVIRAVEMRIAIRDLPEQQRNLGTDLGTMVDLSGNFGSRHLDIKMAVGRAKGSLDVAKVREFTERALHTLEPGYELEKLKLTCRGTPTTDSMDERTEVIDLLQHQEHRVINLQVHPKYRKILHKQRWNALAKIRLEFLSPP